MVNQNKIFSFKIKRQAKSVFPSDVERTVGYNDMKNKKKKMKLSSAEVFTKHARRW